MLIQLDTENDTRWGFEENNNKQRFPYIIIPSAKNR